MKEIKNKATFLFTVILINSNFQGLYDTIDAYTIPIDLVTLDRRKNLMMYLLAILLPPVAVLLSGKPVQAVLNFILCIFFWIPGVIHAILVVNEKKADKRAAKMYARSRQD